jgi:hypothetical protein
VRTSPLDRFPLTDVWSASTAGTDTGRRIGKRRSTVAFPLFSCLSVAAVFTVTLLCPVAPVGADQISDLQAQAAQLSQDMLLEQLQIGGYEQQYAAATLQVQEDQQVLSESAARIAQAQHRIIRDNAVLARDAVKAYIDAGTSSDITGAVFSSGQTSGARQVYEHVVTGNLSTTLDQLQTDRAELRAQVVSQQSASTEDRQAATEAAALLQDALNTQSMLASQSSKVNGQLAVAVQAQQAQEAAAATAALAASRAAVTIVATTGGGPVLNSFLQCVVQAESGGDYQAVSSTGDYLGAFQFSQSTWNEAADLAGMPTLVGVPPNEASPADQDALAIALYAADGEKPWYDPCRTT